MAHRKPDPAMAMEEAAGYRLGRKAIQYVTT